MTYPEQFCRELIQLAAVAAQAIIDARIFTTGHPKPITRSGIMDEILAEMRAQDEKWGSQTHDPRAWLTIMGEEFGEACQAALNWKHEQVRNKHEEIK